MVFFNDKFWNLIKVPKKEFNKVQLNESSIRRKEDQMNWLYLQIDNNYYLTVYFLFI